MHTTPAEMELDFAKALNARDIDWLMGHFREESVFVAAPGSPVGVGLDEIREAMQGFVDANPQLDVETVKVVEANDGRTALMWIRWQLEYEVDGARVAVSGQSPKVVARDGDVWFSLIDNPFHDQHFAALAEQAA